MHRFRALTTCAFALLSSSAVLASSVHAIVATEGPYAVYSGATDATDMKFIGAGPGLAKAGPMAEADAHSFEIEDERYIYIATWGNPKDARGVLANIIFNGVEVLSGDPAWEVYPTPLDMSGETLPPTLSDVSQQIRSANRRRSWKPTGIFSGNGEGSDGEIADISPAAAWMWLPLEGDLPVAADTTDTAPAGVCMIFRIAPTELWPEIQLWHGRNAGTGPTAGASIYSIRPQTIGGGGGSGGGSGGGLTSSGSGSVNGPGYPFPNFDPPNSSSNPPVSPPPDDPTKPIIPTPRIPEPTSALLLLAALAGIRRRR